MALVGAYGIQCVVQNHSPVEVKLSHNYMVEIAIEHTGGAVGLVLIHLALK
jgi:hypothetical protein